jgi:hypothetical protein
MTSKEPDYVSGVEKFTPTKDTYISLKSDVDLKLALQELIDNSLDAWERHSSRQEPATIDISTRSSGAQTELLLKDNTGGVPREEAPVVFALGRTANADVAGSIGTYGLGAKKALVNLGVPFTIASCYPEEEYGWEFQITEEWLQNDDDWGVEIERTDRVDPGETLIHIEDLDYEWDESAAAELRSDLAHTYNLFLDDSLDTRSYDLNILVDGRALDPAGLPDYSYSPFDRIAPQRFENIELNLEKVDAPVRLHVTIGLLRKKDGQLAGTDIYCQNRKVVTAARDEVGGYGSGRYRMGNFTVHHQRLKVLVELETDGEADVLPWDTQKASINRHTEVMQATYQWLRRIAQPYFDMTDNVVPRAFVEFYPQESEHVFNDGEIQIHDYSNRNRMPPHHKPDTDAPQISALQRTAGAHARAGFRCYDAIEDWQRPAYEAQLTAELGPDTDYTNLPVVEGDDPLEGFEETRAVELKNELLKLAKNHARRGIRYADELQPWQKVIYNNHLDTEISGDLETPTSVADVPTTLDELGGMQSSEESETETEDPDPPEPETESKQRAELALIVEDGDQELVGTLIADDREAIAERVGLTADADPDELHAELQRRLELLMELD